MNVYRWQAPGNGRIFDKPLGESSYMNSRTIYVLKFIQEKKRVSQSQFEREIKDHLAQNTEYEENSSVSSHFFRPLLFLGFIRINSFKVLELTLEGDKFLHFYESGEYSKCKKYVLNQLDNSTYPSSATEKIKLRLFPFRILFKLLLDENARGLSSHFLKERLVYLKEYEDLALYRRDEDVEKIQAKEEYKKFYDWVISSLVSIEILKQVGKRCFIADDMLENVRALYSKLSYESLFFNDKTLLCQLDDKIAHERYKRDARLIQEAKSRDNYLCRVNEAHVAFVSKGNNYVEGHHVLPMFQQKNYAFELDDVNNVVSLCPNCHREMHSADDKTEILTSVYETNKEYMRNNGVSLDDLRKMYHCV